MSDSITDVFLHSSTNIFIHSMNVVLFFFFILSLTVNLYINSTTDISVHFTIHYHIQQSSTNIFVKLFILSPTTDICVYFATNVLFILLLIAYVFADSATVLFS